jgi:hypothetical protein
VFFSQTEFFGFLSTGLRKNKGGRFPKKFLFKYLFINLTTKPPSRITAMNKHLAINSGELRLWKQAGCKSVLVLVLCAEISDMTHAYTGWWWVVGNAEDGFKKYLAPSHSLHTLIQEK